MGSVEKRVRDDRLTWVARWRAPDGAQHKRTFGRKSDAERHLTGVEHAMVTGGYVDPAAGRMTVGAWAQIWMAGRVHLKPKTVASYESLLRTRLLPRWGAISLSRVSYADASTWVAEMRSQGLSASRTRQSYHLLTSMLDDAVRAGKLGSVSLR